MAALILVTSIAALIQFAISQWRSIWVTVAQQPISESLQTATGLCGDTIGADDFEMLARTSEQLNPADGNVWLKEVRVYYRLLRAVSGACSKAFPQVADWAKGESVTCSRYAAAILDQRLNANLAYASASQSR